MGKINIYVWREPLQKTKVNIRVSLKISYYCRRKFVATDFTHELNITNGFSVANKRKR